jgi:hypothetical protein
MNDVTQNHQTKDTVDGTGTFHLYGYTMKLWRTVVSRHLQEI